MSKRTATPDQESRVARALRHGEGYSFTELDPGRFICETPAGNSYLTWAEGCSCPDSEFNLRGTEIRCRHRVQLAHWLLEQGRDLEEEAAARRWVELKTELAAERAAQERRAALAAADAEFDRVFGGR